MNHTLHSSFLLFLLILVTLFIVVPTEAQSVWEEDAGMAIPNSQIRRIIILQDTLTMKPLIVREHDFIRYILWNKDKIFKGRITRIHKDTLFLKSHQDKIGSINKLVLYHSGKPDFQVQRSRIYLLPDTAYNSISSKLASKHGIMKNVRIARVLHRTDTIHSNFIKLNLTRLFSFEIALSYERKLSPFVSLEFEVGYQFPLYDRTRPGSGDLLETAQLFSEGFSLLLGPKVYRLWNRRPGFYIEPFAIFKTLRYLNVYLPGSYVSNPSSEFYPFGDKYTTVYGITLRIGTVRKYGKLILDYYTGLGIKVKDYAYYYYGYYDHYDNKNVYYLLDHSAITRKVTEIWPVFNLGIKIGFGF